MAPTGPTDETTLGGASAAETRRGSTPAHSGWLSSSQPGDGRFPSGTILADRYRIIGLLGRGGMGEVYRADDLRLGQPVALKFLPQSVTGDNVRLAQFHNEVRVARQVSHRNVCRVYDIGEADGSIFLTMEYVDGEDLASLLRRIGRFPQDRAIEIARQLCAGLAAAHEQHVLHRDLKPANVMIDREGRVRITDFGLAGLAHEIHDIRAGTPAYMAPEQLAGREVSIRSDIFALGLVLFEIFTGRRAYDAKTIAELLRMHDEGLTVTPSSAVRDLDPVVERVILRCLEREPTRRPSSAIAVSASLPGGDPLAAALAAGETPSPEMVANAGGRDAISPMYGLSAIAIIVAGIIAMARFTAVTPEWTPWAYADRRAAWTGVIPDAGDLPIRVEAASHRGRITSFQILYPWSDRQTTEETPRTFAEIAAEVVGDFVYFGLTLIALVMARRNVRLKRVDRQGAFWTAAVMFTFAMGQWVLEARQAGDTTVWQDRLFTGVAISMLQAGRLWIFYLALEPTVRRFWPDGLISWTRLVSGDWRDPLVGWHVLAGVACGVVLHGTLVLFRLTPLLLGLGSPAPATEALHFITGGGVFAGALVRIWPNGLNTALFLVFCYALGRQLLRRDFYASTAVVVLLSAVIAREFVSGDYIGLGLTFMLCLSTLLVIMLRAYGMLASSCTFAINQLLDVTPLTFDFHAWYAYAALWSFALVAALVIYGYTISRAGQPLFGRRLLGEHADA